MKSYRVQIPVIVSYETECSRPFEHNLELQVQAKDQLEAVSKVGQMLSSVLTETTDA
jgi:hypothetical protein